MLPSVAANGASFQGITETGIVSWGDPLGCDNLQLARLPFDESLYSIRTSRLLWPVSRWYRPVRTPSRSITNFHASDPKIGSKNARISLVNSARMALKKEIPTSPGFAGPGAYDHAYWIGVAAGTEACSRTDIIRFYARF